MSYSWNSVGNDGGSSDASSINNQDKREAEVARIAILEQQLQNLNQNLEWILQENQELNHRLMT